MLLLFFFSFFFPLFVFLLLLPLHLSTQISKWIANFQRSLGNVLKAGPLLSAAWYTPLFVGGILLAIVGGLVLHILSNQILLVIASLGFLFCVLLFAIIPIDAASHMSSSTLYWAYMFPAMCCSTIGIDLSFNVTNVFITTALTKRDQATVGGLTNVVIYVGSSFCLGLSELFISSLSKTENGSRKSLAEQYRIGFWLGVGLAGVGMMLTMTMRLGSASAELTADEKEEMRLAEEAAAGEGRREKDEKEVIDEGIALERAETLVKEDAWEGGVKLVGRDGDWEKGRGGMESRDEVESRDRAGGRNRVESRYELESRDGLDSRANWQRANRNGGSRVWERRRG